MNPLYDINWPPAMKYGVIGSVLGHEIGHGFDPNGFNHDSNGQYRPAMNNASARAYKKMKDCVVEQFNGYCPLADYPNKVKCVDGEHTVGENMAENSGKCSSVARHRKSLSKMLSLYFANI
jgi:putative endopeptidase